ncbi:MAG TPA: hypothetical protein VK306_09425 [Acidimicrobiales bacterium]|nr:hypothetical protein [Acidimicrobiales bacterium]
MASTGPARTGSPAASAVSWQSSSFWAPPPTAWTTSTGRFASVAACATKASACTDLGAVVDWLGRMEGPGAAGYQQMMIDRS